jgi:hypothetical protein
MLRLVDGWCGEALDEEYAELTRRVIGRLARKRRSPLVRGDPRVWAAGELYAAGVGAEAKLVAVVHQQALDRGPGSASFSVVPRTFLRVSTIITTPAESGFLLTVPADALRAEGRHFLLQLTEMERQLGSWFASSRWSRTGPWRSSNNRPERFGTHR